MRQTWWKMFGFVCSQRGGVRVHLVTSSSHSVVADIALRFVSKAHVSMLLHHWTPVLLPVAHTIPTYVSPSGLHLTLASYIMNITIAQNKPSHSRVGTCFTMTTTNNLRTCRAVHRRHRQTFIKGCSPLSGSYLVVPVCRLQSAMWTKSP